jgi:hypothetical protein
LAEGLGSARPFVQTRRLERKQDKRDQTPEDHMRSVLLTFAICGLAQPAAAQFTTTYAGTQTEGGAAVPASALFYVEPDYALMIIKGARSGRMVFDAKAHVLHMINDDNKTYLDIDKSAAGGGDPMQMMQQQLASLPPSQRAMAEGMMKSMSSTLPPPLTYVWSTEKKTVAGYECTRVDGMRGAEKVTEYCGSTSPDLKMTDAERKTMLEMQSYLRNFTIMVKSGNDDTRAFQWDTSTDGYPVITRCYRNGVMTLDLALQSVSRKPVPADALMLPAGYKRMDLTGMTGRPGR